MLPRWARSSPMGVGHPERDTPERADAFAKTFDPRMLELSGSAGEVATVAKEYRIFFRKMPGADPADYLM